MVEKSCLPTMLHKQRRSAVRSNNDLSPEMRGEDVGGQEIRRKLASSHSQNILIMEKLIETSRSLS